MQDLARVEREIYSEKLMRRINNHSASKIYEEAKKHNLWHVGFPGLWKEPIAAYPIFQQYIPLRPPRYDQFVAEHDMQRIYDHYDPIQREYRQQLESIDRRQAELADLDRQYAEILTEIETLLQAA